MSSSSSPPTEYVGYLRQGSGDTSSPPPRVGSNFHIVSPATAVELVQKQSSSLRVVPLSSSSGLFTTSSSSSSSSAYSDVRDVESGAGYARARKSPVTTADNLDAGGSGGGGERGERGYHAPSHALGAVDDDESGPPHDGMPKVNAPRANMLPGDKEGRLPNSSVTTVTVAGTGTGKAEETVALRSDEKGKDNGKDALALGNAVPGDGDDEATVLRKRRWRIAMVVSLFVGVICAFIFAFSHSVSGPKILTFSHGGIERQYVYHGPDKGQGVEALVAVLHGYGGYALDMIPGTGMNDLADRDHFAVVYPFGSIDNHGKSFFNVGYDFNAGETVDDGSFITDLMLSLAYEHKLNLAKLYVTGFSNGGEICYMLACRFPHVLRAVAPVAGMMLEKVRTSEACANPDAEQSSRAISILEIHGTEDPVNFWGGDMANIGGWGAYPSTMDTMSYWKLKYSCGAGTVNSLPNPDTTDGKYTVARKFFPCTFAQGTAEVWLYESVGGGHEWNLGGGDYSTSEAVWSFFKKF